MNFADVINGLFEAFGFVAVLLSCFKLLKDKQVKGVSLSTVGFFTSWGFWNMFYYPHLGQAFSTVAAVCVCMANCFWFALILKYRAKREVLVLETNPLVCETCFDEGNCAQCCMHEEHDHFVCLDCGTQLEPSDFYDEDYGQER